jgi:hypothetical protein
VYGHGQLLARLNFKGSVSEITHADIAHRRFGLSDAHQSAFDFKPGADIDDPDGLVRRGTCRPVCRACQFITAVSGIKRGHLKIPEASMASARDQYRSLWRGGMVSNLLSAHM